MRALGALLLLAAAVIGTIGGAWTTFAIIGTEWDYCPNGRDCIPGELAGLTIVAVAALAGWSGLLLLKRG